MINIYGLKIVIAVEKLLSGLMIIIIRMSFLILKNLITKNKIKEWLKVHGIDKILNKKSTTWRQLDQNLRDNYESDALTILENFPTLIKRPFWEINSKTLKTLEPGFLDEQKKLLEELKK